MHDFKCKPDCFVTNCFNCSKANVCQTCNSPYVINNITNICEIPCTVANCQKCYVNGTC